MALLSDKFKLKPQLSGADIKSLYEVEADTNAFTDAEKNKLAGIEDSATADQTAAEILTAIKTVDGAGSGLDADTVDGLEANSFATAAQGLKADALYYRPTDVKTSAYTAVSGDAVLCDTTAGAFTVTLPASGTVKIVDYAGTSAATGFGVIGQQLTITPSGGSTIMGETSIDLDVGQTSYIFTLYGTDWKLFDIVTPWIEVTDWSDIVNKPTLGTAAATNSTDYATAAQGALADSALQPGTIGVTVQGYNANTVIDSAYVHTDNNYTTTEKDKLAGIESGATADQTASEILTAIKTVDGTGSGLDADLLDGLHSSSFVQTTGDQSIDGQLQITSLNIQNRHFVWDGTVSLSGTTIGDWKEFAQLSIPEAGGILEFNVSFFTPGLQNGQRFIIPLEYGMENAGNSWVKVAPIYSSGLYDQDTTAPVYDLEINTKNSFSTFYFRFRQVSGTIAWGVTATYLLEAKSLTGLPTFSTIVTTGNTTGTLPYLKSSRFSNVDGIPRVENNLIWHEGNDGAGSGLDADTVDGIQGASIITTTGGQTISGSLTATTFTSTQTTGTAPFTVSSTTVVPNLNADLLDGLNSSAFVQSASGDQVINTINIGLGGGGVFSNTAVGVLALNSNTTGVQNTAFGYNALRANNTGNENTAIGRECLSFNINGGQNTAIGNATLYNNISGSHNTGVGLQSLTSNTTGSENVGVGNSSLPNIKTGTRNTGIGRRSSEGNYYGSDNVCIGYLSGRYSGRVIAVTGTITGKGYYIHTVGDTDFTLIGAANNNIGTFFVATGAGTGTGTVAQVSSNNVFIGSSSASNIENGSNNIVIGHSSSTSSANVDNEITLGNGFISAFRIPGINVTANTTSFTAPTFTSTQTTGTAPFTVSSTTVVPNLNADLLDGHNIGTGGNSYIPYVDSSGLFTGKKLVTTFNTSTDSGWRLRLDPVFWGMFIDIPKPDDNTSRIRINGGSEFSGTSSLLLAARGGNAFASSSSLGNNSYDTSDYNAPIISRVHSTITGFTFKFFNNSDAYKTQDYVRLIRTDTDGTQSNYWDVNYLGNVGIGTISQTEKLEVVGNIKATQFISTQATGTAPFTVSSTTVVPNLNADLLDGHNTSQLATASTVAVRDSLGNLFANNLHAWRVTRTLPTSVGDCVDIGSLSVDHGAHSILISVTCSSSAFSVSKTYAIATNYSASGGAWQIVTPLTATGPYYANDFQLEVNTADASIYLRVRKTSGSIVGSIVANIINLGYGTATFNESSTVTPLEAAPEVTAYHVGSGLSQEAANLTYRGNTIWHAGNDGSGSGLDADLLDGLEGTAFTKVSQPIVAVTYNDGGNSTLDHSAGNCVFTLTSNGTSTTIVHSNVPNGVRYAFELHLTWTAGAITFPTSWTLGDSPPSTTGNYIVTGITINGGTDWALAVMVL